MTKHQLITLFLFLSSLSVNAQFSGNALDFDGSDDAVTISNVPAALSAPASNDITIESWVKPKGAAFQRIFFAQASTSNFMALTISGLNEIYFYVVANGTNYCAATTATLASNTWTHVAVTWSGSTNTQQIYFNGVLQTSNFGGTSSTGTNGLVTIGTRPGGTQNFNGTLEELRVWNKKLTTCEIVDNMYNSITTTPVGLIMNYHFNSGTAGNNNAGITTLNDDAGIYNGTLSGFALNGTTSNWITSTAGIGFSGNPANSVNTNITNSGNTITANLSGATYVWLDCNNNLSSIPGETAQSYTATTTGNYAVQITYNGCVGLSQCIPITVLSNKVPLLTTPVSIYPNPARDVLVIDMEEGTTGTIELTDLSGVVVRTQAIQGLNTNLDLNGVADGMYLVNITTPKGRMVKQIVKSGN